MEHERRPFVLTTVYTIKHGRISRDARPEGITLT
jgi:hypothetical protein